MMREMQSAIEDEQRKSNESREAYAMAERRTNAVQGECEEIRSALETSERGRKSTENELIETSDRVNELAANLQSVGSQKRKLEGDIGAMQTDLEEMSNEVRTADEKAKKAIMDAQRLADEVRSEKDHSTSIEKMRHSLESQVKELNVRLDEAEAAALKGGKKTIAKLEVRVCKHSSINDKLNCALIYTYVVVN